jgi:hypothetical protein
MPIIKIMKNENNNNNNNIKPIVPTYSILNIQYLILNNQIVF